MEKLRNLVGLESSSESGIELNEMLAYELIKDDEVWIHIDDVRDLSLTKKLKLFRDGLRDLAELLQHEPGLAKVKRVSGMSWIVSKNPTLVKSLGFDVAESLEGLEGQLTEYQDRKDDRDIHKEDPPGYAYMDKEKLIQLYGKTTAPDLDRNRI